MSRVKHKVPPGAKLSCSVCLTDHPVSEFGINASADRYPCYYSFCKSAQRMRSRLATWYKDSSGKRHRRYPDHAAVRAALLGVVPASPRPTLKSAGHKRPQRRPVRDSERAERIKRLRAEARRLEREAAAAEEDRQGYVYLVIEVKPGGGLEYGKIGYSTDPHGRLASLQTANPRPLKLQAYKPGTEDDERALHEKYHKMNVLQEWFRLTPEIILEWGVEHYAENMDKEVVAA